MKYRPEIDGLRALAVIPVIFFHAGIKLFAGGYVGVDIFFVISGYLITSIIISDLNSEKFSLSFFYEKRARRILPALYFIMLISFIFAWLYMTPPEMKSYSESLAAVSIFGSNFLFYLTSGYFEPSAELIPFLHTWSLAVEEQYYLLFPLFLIFTWKKSRVFAVSSMVFMLIVSILAAQWGSKAHPTFTFYLLPTRLWELLLGGLGAILILPKNYMSIVQKDAIGFIGLLLIFFSIFSFDERVPYPSFYTLIPTIGTLLILISASRKNKVGLFLGAKPLVYTGLASYSAYLWHQPVFAFYRIQSLDIPDAKEMLALTLLVFLLSLITWKYVELPFRKNTFISKKKFCTISILMGLSFVALGVVSEIKHGFVSRFSPVASQLYSEISFNWRENVRYETCVLHDSPVKYDPLCLSKKRPSIVLWGDSHAAALYPGLKNLQSIYKFGITQLTQAGCGPILDLSILVFSKNCNEINAEALKVIETNPPDVLILHAAWRHKDYPLSNNELKRKTIKTIELVKKITPNTRVIIIGPVPFWQVSPQNSSFRYWLQGRGDLVFIPNYLPAARLDDVDYILRQVSQMEGAIYISPLSFLCEKNGCLTRTGERDIDFIQIDSRHLSRSGSEFFINQIQGYLMLQ